MSELRVDYTRKGAEQRIQAPGLGELVIDHSGVPEEQRGGTAKQLLASSVLYCFCGALGKALESRGAKYEKITGSAVLRTGVDDKKRARVTGIDMDITVFMDEEYEFIFDRVSLIMQQGCLISASLEAAFPVSYKINMES